MTKVVVGTSNQNFYKYRQLRYFDKQVRSMSFENQRHQKNDFFLMMGLRVAFEYLDQCHWTWTGLASS